MRHLNGRDGGRETTVLKLSKYIDFFFPLLALTHTHPNTQRDHPWGGGNRNTLVDTAASHTDVNAHTHRKREKESFPAPAASHLQEQAIFF